MIALKTGYCAEQDYDKHNPINPGDLFYKKSKDKLNSGQFDSAILYINQAIHQFESEENLNDLAGSYNLLGIIMRKNGDIDGAITNHKVGLKIFRQLNDSLGIVKSYNALGILYNNIALYDSSLFYYLKMIRIAKKINYMDGFVAASLNISQNYIDLGEYENASKYLLGCLDQVPKSGDLSDLAMINNKLGILEYSRKNYDSALNYYNTALKLYAEKKDIRGMGTVRINIGVIYLNTSHLDSALINFKKAKSLSEKVNNKTGILNVINNIGVVYQWQHSYNQALAQYDSCLLLARELGANDYILTIYNNYHDLYKEINNNSKALEYLEKYVRLKDSLFSIEKSEIVADLELKYEKEKDQARILTLENQNLQKDLELRKESARKNMFLMGWVVFLLIGFFIILYYRQRIKKNKVISEQKLLKAEEEKKVASAQALIEGQEEERFRISRELHDGVGALLSTATLYITSIEEEHAMNSELVLKARKMVSDANTDVRKISRNLMPSVLAVHGLNDALSDLIETIDALPDKYGDFNVIGKPRKLSKSHEIMIYRLVQEMINNTMKHARAKSVDLVLDYQENELIITYNDDGTGFDFDKMLEKKSVGLKSITSRVDYLKGKLDFWSKEGKGSSFTVHIPY